jgi:hypothetical protein
MLFIKCPTTGKYVPTGINAPADNKKNINNNTVGCPACGLMHQWNGVDSLTEDELIQKGFKKEGK